MAASYPGFTFCRRALCWEAEARISPADLGPVPPSLGLAGKVDNEVAWPLSQETICIFTVVTPYCEQAGQPRLQHPTSKQAYPRYFCLEYLLLCQPPSFKAQLRVAPRQTSLDISPALELACFSLYPWQQITHLLWERPVPELLHSPMSLKPHNNPQERLSGPF